MPARHRMTRLRIEGMRTLESVDLDVNGLRVLIGENGSGKSSILEAVELLRRTRSPEFWADLHQIHGGVHALLRHGARSLSLGCTFAPLGGPHAQPIAYDITVSERGVVSETVELGTSEDATSMSIIDRADTDLSVCVADGSGRFPQLRGTLAATKTAVAAAGSPNVHPRVADLQSALDAIEVHVPFDVTAAWIANAHRRPLGVRGAVTVAPAERIERLGLNLANVYQALRNERSTADWEKTMDWVRLGLGDWVEAVTVRADAAGGNVGLWVKHAGLDLHLPARALSDGQIQFLGLVALCRLTSDASIVAFDEPEAHLHPRLQDRAAQFFGELAERCPVLLATHSRRVLDQLDDPVDAVRICSVAGNPPATVVQTVDAAALEGWMRSYEGLGRVLDAGLGELVVRDAPPSDYGE